MHDYSRSNEVLTDPELERALIASLFADNANADRLGRLTPEDLVDPILAAIFAGAMNIREEGHPISLVTLKSRLQGMHVDDDLTGVDILRSLSVGEALPSTDHIATRLRALAVRRRLAEGLRCLVDAASDESLQTANLVADGIRQLNDCLAEALTEDKTSFELHPAAHEFIIDLQAGGDPVEIPTGLSDLDEATGGWHRGQFAILAGRPSMGKSAVALSSMIRTALKGDGVLFFSLEMTRQQVVSRALADLALTNQALAYSDLKVGRVSVADIARLKKASAKVQNLPLVVETRNGLTAGDIFARARRAIEEFNADGRKLSLIVVDHLLKVRPSNRYAGQSVKEIDEISEAMCVLAKSLNVAVLGLHQLSRGVESRENQRPVLSDLRGSGSLEQDADVVLFVFRPAYQFERQLQEDGNAAAAEVKLAHVKHDLEIQIAKQRNGPTKTLRFWVDMSANAVRDKAMCQAHQNARWP